MISKFLICAIQNVDSEKDVVGCGFPFFAMHDDDAVAIVKRAMKGIPADQAKGYYVVQIGAFYPLESDQLISGCAPRVIASCLDLSEPGEEETDEGSEV